MIDKIFKIIADIDNLKAKNPEEFEALRIKYLSKKGIVNSLMSEFRTVSPDKKKEVGLQLNLLKNSLQDRINELKRNLEGR